MTYEVSSGAVVFTREGGGLRYVIVRSLEGYYGFPKGHIEGKETEEEAAIREIREETGLSVRLVPGFRTIDEHSIPKKPDVVKWIIYFLGEYEGQEIRFQREELLEAPLLSYEEAMERFQFESSRRILKEANDFLTAAE
jgi:8-oxo-dGTP pyrophosphatase MutT (NUDIX family)